MDVWKSRLSDSNNMVCLEIELIYRIINLLFGHLFLYGYYENQILTEHGYVQKRYG